jgi:arylsulfatase I/J
VNPLNTGVLVHNPDDPISGFQGIPRNMTGLGEVMGRAGYERHFVGKWDAGMATPDHTPVGRGYESFFGYFQHANNYWNKEGHIEATGDVDLCLNRFTDLFMENSTYRGGVLDAGYLDDSCSNTVDDADPECYEEKIFKDQALKVIDE